MICPICDKEIINYSKINMEHTLTEEHAICKDEHHIYSYQKTPQMFVEQIGGVIFRNHQDDSEENIKQYRMVVELNRQGYQKRKR
ncbi:hypothetical protein MKZ07_14550 [Paenibacillus sp. FSL P4-0338]|uniref:hypothetical protein n=1 Tax=Paenibacillus sp. FSL P4-0338 TaxID=2921635 RepID=UPI0030F4CED9